MGTDRTWKRNKARQERNGGELDLMMRALSAPLGNGFSPAMCVYVCVKWMDGGGVSRVFHGLNVSSLFKTLSFICQLQPCFFILLLSLSHCYV